MQHFYSTSPVSEKGIPVNAGSPAGDGIPCDDGSLPGDGSLDLVSYRLLS